MNNNYSVATTTPTTSSALPPIRLIGSPVLHTPVPRFTPTEIAGGLENLVVNNDEGVAYPLKEAVATLHAVLDDFRAKNGFGRAIAANQIGFPISIIAARLPMDPMSQEDKEKNPAIRYTFVNPEVLTSSAQRASPHTLWDDCFSFPTTYVAVVRPKKIDFSFLDFGATLLSEEEEEVSQVSSQYKDDNRKKDDHKVVRWVDVDEHLSELLQHENDHLLGKTSFDSDWAEAALDTSRITGEKKQLGGVQRPQPWVVERAVFDRNPRYYYSLVDYTPASAAAVLKKQQEK